MRLDKFLKVSRIIKRRTIAKDACDKGRVLVNGKVAKAGTEVNVSDIIKVCFGNNEVQVKVTSLKENVKKEDVESMYQPV